LRPHRLDRLRQALEAVADYEAHIGGATILDLGQHPHPVLRALSVAVLAGPQPEHVAGAVDGDRERDVDRPVSHVPVPDLHVHTVNEDHRIDRIQRPARCES
jgi:hypothetical protein